MRRTVLFLLVITGFASLGFAQESTEEDPFSDYSYLWEDSKKKKKDKKKKQKVEAQVADVAADSSVTTTSSIPVDSVQVDSTSLEEELVVVDSTNLIEDSLVAKEVNSTQDSIRQAEKDAKREARKEKQKDKEPAKDFRAGLPSPSAGSSLNGGLTYTNIDGKAYAGLVLAPELKFGKVGVGIDVPILYGLDDKTIRTEMFEDGVGALRLIRYVRYGQQKVDPVYVKVGDLSGTMIGFGGLVNNYTNSVSYEKRKIGLHYDINVKGLAGIEGMCSDFDPASFNLFVIRPYVRPLSWTFIPIVKTLEIGTTILSDHDQTTLIGSEEARSTYAFTEEGIRAFGIDMGVTLLTVPFIQIDLFANYSKLDVATEALADTLSVLQTAGFISMPTNSFEKGSGVSAGFNFRFNFIADLLSTDIRIERLSYSDYYLPQFFDGAYEIDKDSKILALASAEKMKGIYGSLKGHILKKLTLGGSLMIPDEISETAPAVVTLNADVDRLFNKFSMHARYYKGGLTDLGDAFSLDERSLAKVRFVYHLNKFLVTGVDYFYSFTATESGYKTTKYVSPYFGVSIQL
ncbi:hypothetical protein SAMN04488029_0192 [Reichenbachiella faecimaris]|uniref:DUF5723 domain-containing protein n=1 Tax=Reichenbachiella faecimaris TaxID=692418 RepID=A0A1W2G5P5_REIFA|nr:hypothetical protein [Reichenbachiella faecimaris]SMD31854.1 hypothetical protein SAMN04488029_0192 [Reichenbachiella faecimaris]